MSLADIAKYLEVFNWPMGGIPSLSYILAKEVPGIFLDLVACAGACLE